MFDSLTKSKFYTKCKSLIKMTKARLEASKKKKNVVANYLKNDIADLLRAGFDSNAYSRTQELIFDHNLIAAYKFLEDFCDCISTNLALLDKRKECPKECREAIHSLMYAAARLAEFPELRDLRSLFAHRYGDCVELYINKEFGELLNRRLATKEMKLQLLGDVAQEFSINWDPKSLEQKPFKPPHSIQQQNQNRNEGSNNPEDGDHKRMKSKDDVVALSSKHNRFNKYGKRESHSTSSTENLLGRSTEAEVAASPRRKNNVSDENHRLQSSSGSAESTDRDSSQPSPSSMGTTSTSTASKDEVDSIKIPYRFLPPPYVRTRLDKQDVKDQSSSNSSSPDTAESSSESQPKPGSVRRRQQMKVVVGDEISPLKPAPGRAYFGSFDAEIWKASDDDEEGEDEELKGKKSAQYERPIVRSYKLKPLSWKSRDHDESGKEELVTGSALPFGSLGKTSAAIITRHGRSLSAESKVSSGHVHPNLPDYDSLAARVAAFLGK